MNIAGGEIASGEARTVGRPPGPHGDTLAKLLPVALRIFLAEGGAALTPTRLHRETGIARATIYRNWPEPDDLIEIMLHKATEFPAGIEPSGDLRADLQRAMTTLLHRFDRRPARAFFAACLEYGRRSERVSTAAEAFISGILEQFRVIIATAVDAGELDGSVDDLVAEIAGPPILRHVLMGERLTADDGVRMVDAFVEHRRT